ncbi:MAG TPA: hypothetical protein VFP34_00815 [Microlunatus sp.]|nr:hypothetical protein [Microlunatus sp.]
MPHTSLKPPALQQPRRVSRAAQLLRLIVAPQRRVDAQVMEAQSRLEAAQRRRAAAEAQSAHIRRVAGAFEDVCADLEAELDRTLAEIAADPSGDDASRAQAAEAAVADIQGRRALARSAAAAHLSGIK